METVIENNIETPVLPEKVTVEYILGKIEQIQAENEQFYNDISKRYDGSSDTGLEQLKTIVMCRETTNQRIIEFYKKIYDGIKPVNKIESLSWIKECIGTAKMGVKLPDFVEIIKQLNSI